MRSGTSGRLPSNRRAAQLVCRKVSRLLFASILVFCTTAVLADDRIRQVQEELRKRHLYFGDIDGRENAELHNALRRYQARKGFTASGEVDSDTAASLGLAATVTVATTSIMLPDEPVLKSDFARELPPQRRQELESETENTTGASPPPPAESPAPADNLTPERVTKFVEDYLRDGESNDPAAQNKYYAFPLRYMNDGVQDAAYVQDDATKQIRHWPRRRFMLAGPVNFFSTGEPGQAHVEFTYAFEEARHHKAIAKGQARQRWTVRAQGDEMKITQIDEEIVRPSIAARH